MKDTIGWVIAAVLATLTPIQEYIFTCELLILLNWIAFEYVKIVNNKKTKKRSVPVYAKMMFVMVAIVVSRVIDELYTKSYVMSYSLSLGLVYFELYELFKSISIIIGFDITKFIKRK